MSLAEFDQDGQVINNLIRDANGMALGAARPIVELRAESAIGVRGQIIKVAFVSMRVDVARRVRVGGESR